MPETNYRHRDLLDAVHSFNRRGQTVPPDNTFNAERVCFHTGLQCEELAEKLLHIADGAVDGNERHILAFAAGQLDALGKDFKAGKHQGAVLRADREKLLDDDADMLVVSAGSAMFQTPFFRHAVDAVLGANDNKEWPDGTFHHNENGKIIKPEGWVEPDLSPFIVQPNT